MLYKKIGYPVISHEGIRQQVLNTGVIPKEKQKLDSEIIFIEVDGFYS